ncbi:MAG TPA: phosphatase PAP2 family protein [Xanthobacteraceae bacterium]|nr:phosphatase PAP2 family protein [Xanthobacteraceae bacterium]
MDVTPTIMMDDAEAAWRFFHINWIVVGAMGAVLALSLLVTNFSIELAGLAVAVGYVGIYGGFAHANACSPRRRDPQVMFVLGATAQIVLITAVMAPLTYVAAATDLPLQDANLLVIDRALGFDWAAYVNYVNDHPTLAAWLSYGYTMIRWPIFAIPVVLAAMARYQRIEEFTFAFAAALIATTIISALVPAIGVYQQIGLDPANLQNLDPGAYLEQVRDFAPTRDGTLRHLQLLGLAGIVTFPSFHAASAALYAWALWPSRLLRPIVVLANGAMLAATPIVGGHYFIDVIAGVAIAALAIVAARRVGRSITRRQVGLALAAPMPAIVAAK